MATNVSTFLVTLTHIAVFLRNNSAVSCFSPLPEFREFLKLEIRREREINLSLSQKRFRLKYFTLKVIH